MRTKNTFKVEPVDHRFMGSNLSAHLRIDQVLRLYLY